MKLVVFLSLAAILSAAPARAEDWFLMAPYENVLDNPMSVHELSPNAANSPVSLISHGTFSSQGDCNSARIRLMQEWRDHGTLSEQQFHQYGGASMFFRCVLASDPHLVMTPGDLPKMTLSFFSY